MALSGPWLSSSSATAITGPAISATAATAIEVFLRACFLFMVTPEPEIKKDKEGQPEKPTYAHGQIMSLLPSPAYNRQLFESQSRCNSMAPSNVRYRTEFAPPFA